MEVQEYKTGDSILWYRINYKINNKFCNEFYKNNKKKIHDIISDECEFFEDKLYEIHKNYMLNKIKKNLPITNPEDINTLISEYVGYDRVICFNCNRFTRLKFDCDQNNCIIYRYRHSDNEYCDRCVDINRIKEFDYIYKEHHKLTIKNIINDNIHYELYSQGVEGVDYLYSIKFYKNITNNELIICKFRFSEECRMISYYGQSCKIILIKNNNIIILYELEVDSDEDYKLKKYENSLYNKYKNIIEEIKSYLNDINNFFTRRYNFEYISEKDINNFNEGMFSGQIKFKNNFLPITHS